jgi:hypothetical protein
LRLGSCLVHRQHIAIELRFPCRFSLSSTAIALSLIAAEAIVSTYLRGRTMSDDLLGAIVCEVRTRLIDGKVPVLDTVLCSAIEDGSVDRR